MNAKEYLSQARFLDQRINSKIQQVSALNTLAEKCTATVSGMPHNPTPNTSSMEEVIVKIIDLQAEINHDINELVELKHEIMSFITSVPDLELQTLLEKRYLCFQSWECIAVEMRYSMHYMYKLHNRALEFCNEILNRDT